MVRSPCPEVSEVEKGQLHQRLELFPAPHAERAEQNANAGNQLVADSPRGTDTEPTEGGKQFGRSLLSTE